MSARQALQRNIVTTRRSISLIDVETARRHAGRLSDRLTAAFGSQNIFMDVEAIAPGLDFAASIVQEIRYADVFLVLIGPEWSTLEDADGRRLIDSPSDFIRLEVGTALASGKPVIPVLIMCLKYPSNALDQNLYVAPKRFMS
jgi:hypothetical protein